MIGFEAVTLLVLTQTRVHPHFSKLDDAIVKYLPNSVTCTQHVWLAFLTASVCLSGPKNESLCKSDTANTTSESFDIFDSRCSETTGQS